MGSRDVLTRLCSRFDDPAFTLLFVLFCTQALTSFVFGAMVFACVCSCCVGALIGIGTCVRAPGESTPADVTFATDDEERS